MQDNILYDQANDRVFLKCARETFYFYPRQAPMGQGGMGVVLRGWSARDGRMVAIKQVHDKYANIPEVRNRARHEASLAFRHDNLVEMIGFCESLTGTGPIFIVSNFISGINVDKYINDNFNRFDEAEREKRIVTLMLPVLDALEYIHRYGIYHLDIKPSNIMIEHGRNIRLMDLGIAMNNSEGSSVHGMSRQPRGLGLTGTPKYAAPEQFGYNGNINVDARTDIYEFGVTLYELLAGFNPFKADSLAAAMDKHQNNLLPFVDNVSRPVLEVLQKAANPNRQMRYANVGELRQALKAALDEPKVSGFRRFLGKVGF